MTNVAIFEDTNRKNNKLRALEAPLQNEFLVYAVFQAVFQFEVIACLQINLEKKISPTLCVGCLRAFSHTAVGIIETFCCLTDICSP